MPPSANGNSGGRVLAVLFLGNILNFYDRLILGALAEPVRREFALSDVQIGGLATLFTVFYAVAGLPLGWLADRWSRRKLLMAAITVWSAATALGGVVSNYAGLLATRLGVGAGQAAYAPAATSWLGDAVPAARRTRAMAWFMIGVPAGSLLSFAAGGAVAQAWGWRAALVVAALPALALVPALALLPEPPRAAATPGGAGAWPLLRQPPFLWIIVSGAVLNFALYTFSTFLPAFLSRVYGLSTAEAGVWAGLGTGLAGAAGGIAAGAWGDRAGCRGAGGRLSAAALTALAAAIPALAGVAAGRLWCALAGLMLAYGLLNTYYGLVYAAIQDLVPPPLRATAMAVFFLALYLCGGAFGPLATGRLSDALARRASGAGPLTEAARSAGLQQAMYVIPALAAMVALVLWAAARAAATRSAAPARP